STLGRCLQGALLIERGDLAGLPLLQTALGFLRESRFGFAFLGTLARGLGAAGRVAEARAVIDEVLERSERSEGRWCVAELLRIKGDLFRLGGSGEAAGAAEDQYLKALECARRQQELSWELRAATSLARLWHEVGRTADASELLSSVYDRFT